jgi:hypothetical protein
VPTSVEVFSNEGFKVCEIESLLRSQEAVRGQ